MGRFKAAPRLDERVAAMVAPSVEDIAEQVAGVARALAPPLKVWKTMGDGRVRDQHVKVAGQERPSNLRFALESYEWDMQHRGVGETTYLLFPRDESGLAYVALVHCRCWTTLDHEAIRKRIKAGPAVVTGKTVTCTVSSEGEWVIEAEFGTVYPNDLVSPGTFYMARAASQVARARRGR